MWRRNLVIHLRRQFRIALRWLSLAVIGGLSRSELTGLDRFPRRGPYIVAGNHRGIMEVALMVMAAPAEIEIIGAGDIPLDRRYRYFANMYGYIPYRRGQLDRQALREAQHVLERGGVVGIFPEGGIWQNGRSSAHRGVAWLSFTTGAPVIPVGFGGVSRAIHELVTLEFPRLEGRVGAPISPGDEDPALPRKARMEHFAESVLDHIEELIPQWDREVHDTVRDQSYELIAQVEESRTGAVREVQHDLYRPDLLAKLLHFPTLVNVFYLNLARKSTGAMRRPNRWLPVDKLEKAAQVIYGYSRVTNPGFFRYRFGNDEAAQLDRALLSFCRFLAQAREQDPKARIKLIPIYRYRRVGEAELHEERHPDYTPWL